MFYTTLFLVLILTTSWVVIFSGLKISYFTCYFSLLSVVILHIIIEKTDYIRNIITIFLFLLIVAISVFLSSVLYDVTGDGAGYHLVTVIALASGWNPVWDQHFIQWWMASFPDLGWLGLRVANGGIWTDHYPLASYILGAAVTTVTQSVNTSKWASFLLTIISALALARGLVLVGLPKVFSVIIGITASLSPVVVTQLGTNLVDGLLSSLILLQLGAMLAWVQSRQASDLFVAIAALAIGANVKFTGVAYAAVSIPLLIYFVVTFAKRINLRQIYTIVLGVAFFATISMYTYVHNLFFHGHIFYPINIIDVITSQATYEYLNFYRIEKILLSIFSPPDNDGPINGSYNNIFVVPRIWHYFIIMRDPDFRIAGFGTLFGYCLIGSLLIMPYALIRNGGNKKSEITLLLMTVGWLLACVAINPVSWWARYVPQLWFVPLLLSALLWISRQKTFSLMIMVPALAGSALSVLFWLDHNNARNTSHREVLQRVVGVEHVALAGDGLLSLGIFVAYHYLMEKGIAAHDAPDATNCKIRLGMALMCVEIPPVRSSHDVSDLSVRGVVNAGETMGVYRTE